jgi:hypothetical protein
MSTCFNAWNEDVIGDVFYGYNSGPCDEMMAQPVENNRTRKVTITEITEDSSAADWSLDDLNDDTDDLDTDEIHKIFENILEDWKIKMEVIIGDGLKKLRKSNKERRLMLKYLPGDKKVLAAKKTTVKDWKIDFQKGLGSTHKKLDKLANEKAKEVDLVASSAAGKKSADNFNQNKKDVVNIDYLTGKKDGGSSYSGLKNLIKELDKMCNILSEASPTLHSIPIYSKEARGQILPAYNNEWLSLRKSMMMEKEMNVYLKHRPSFLEVLEDFKVSLFSKIKLEKFEKDGMAT